jgi:hypothetical protein
MERLIVFCEEISELDENNVNNCTMEDMRTYYGLDME